MPATPFQRRKNTRTTAIAALVGVALVAAPLATMPAFANTAGTGVVISEAYLNGGSAGATFNAKFVELFNPTDAAVPLSGSSLQYRSATGTANPTTTVALTGTVPAHGYYLVQGASNGTTPVGAALPTPDQTSTTLNVAAGGGTIILAAQPTTLSAPPTGSVVGNPAISDLLGYGTSNTFETADAPAASVSTSIARTAGADSDSNTADFRAGAATPTNSAGQTGGTTTPPPTDPVPATIEQVQGTTDTSPYSGQTVTTTGVVTAAYPTGGFAGYYVQTPGTGGAVDVASHTASDALFVYSPSTVGSVAIGDYVRVTGAVSEYQGLTELSVASGALAQLSDSVAEPAPASVDLPLTAAGRESFEGMLVDPAGDFTITDNYDANYYGSIVLNPGDSPLITPTQAVEPGQPAIDYAAANAARTITLDDGSSLNFNSAANKDIPLPYLSTSEPVRIGAAVTFTKPMIFEYRFSAWSLQPTQQLTRDNAVTVQTATFENTREAKPADVGGDITLASFNVLNYFTTTGDQLAGCEFYTDRDGNPITVADGCDARGAANAENLSRQQAKIVAAINALGADVVSLEEIENSVKFGLDRDASLATLVDALNAAAGSTVWSFVPSPTTMPATQDVIRTAFIYKTAVVKPVGASVVLDDPAFVNARQPLAQEFELASGDPATAFLAIVNHFKSKGSGDGENADQGDGQGASNASRVAQAHALVAFADNLKASTGVSRVLLDGDFNSYLKEDPIDVILAAGYTDLGSTTGKSTYAFDGAVGSLDHIFASSDALTDVAGVDIWNVNAFESVALEYSRYNYNALNLYEPNAFRSSDHDPILVGLNLAPDLKQLTKTPKPVIVGLPLVGFRLYAVPGVWKPAPVTLTYQWSRDGVPIAGATGASYKLVAADRKHTITLSVTGSKPGYASATESRSTIRIR